jgi:hypothetical protein
MMNWLVMERVGPERLVLSELDPIVSSWLVFSELMRSDLIWDDMLLTLGQ